MPTKQRIPIPPSQGSLQPTLCILCLWIYLFYVFHVKGLMEHMAFCAFFLSLTIKFSKFIHVVTRIRTSFIFMTEYYSIMRIDHILFPHSSIYGHVGYFHLLAIVSYAVMNMCVWILASISVFNPFGYIPACLLSHFSHVQLFVTLWAVAHQAPLFMEFSRQDNWSELPFPSPGHILYFGIKGKIMYE